jgi:hypothetical protein
MKKAITYNRVWNPKLQPNFFKLPENCLSYTIANKGVSKVLINNSEELEAGEYYPVEHHVGYFHTGAVELDILDKSQLTKIHFRITVEETV